MNIQKLVNEWVAASNAFDTKKYLEFYRPDSVLNDPSVGREFVGYEGIEEYFYSYFIGYNTRTEIINLKISGDEHSAHLEVEFTGDFPEGEIRGTFDFRFRRDKIGYIKAELIHQ